MISGPNNWLSPVSLQYNEVLHFLPYKYLERCHLQTGVITVVIRELCEQ
jgi:hypothetical protein